MPLLAELLRRVGTGLPDPRPSPVVDRMVAVLTGDAVPSDVDGYRSALAAAAGMHPALEHLVPAVAGITMAPTMLTRVEQAHQLMPGRASVELDCRILPGTTEADVEREVRQRLGNGIPYELDWPEQLVAGSSSPAEGPLFDICQSFLDIADPGHPAAARAVDRLH